MKWKGFDFVDCGPTISGSSLEIYLSCDAVGDYLKIPRNDEVIHTQSKFKRFYQEYVASENFNEVKRSQGQYIHVIFVKKNAFLGQETLY